MLLNDFIDIMNKLAPQDTALGFDNVGLIIGTDRKQIKRVLEALFSTAVSFNLGHEFFSSFNFLTGVLPE